MRPCIVIGCCCTAIMLAGLPVTLSAQQTLAATAASSLTRESAELLARPVTVHLVRVPLRQAVNTIATTADVKIGYQIEALDAMNRPVSINIRRAPLGSVLEQVLASANLRVVVVAANALALEPLVEMGALRDEILVKVVHAKTRQPVRGATVLLGTESAGVTTDADGIVRLSAADGEQRLTVRALGFTSQTRRITVTTGNVTTIEFVLEPSASVLDEIVVTGSVVATERKAIPTPITVITAEEIERRGITRIEDLLRGSVPGVIAIDRGTATYSNDSLGAQVQSQVYARGASSLWDQATPLKTYVDGVELADPAYLGTIDPRSIEKIEIVTGPQAATIYGSGAQGGVMQIFTKKGSGSRLGEVTLRLSYGMLENSASSSRTPVHHHLAAFQGGMGPEFTYSANLSYLYSGQWRPMLFQRGWGAQLGVAHTRDRFRIAGSVSTTANTNGTYTSYVNLGERFRTSVEQGFFDPQLLSRSTAPSQIRANSLSQLLSFTVDFRQRPSLIHDITVGRSSIASDLDPIAPRFHIMSDTMMRVRDGNDVRTSFGYNSTLMPFQGYWLVPTITLGVSGAQGKRTSFDGCKLTAQQTAIAGCFGGTPVISSSTDDNLGAFLTSRLSLWQKIFFSFGLRAERNSAYGRDVDIDWTPSNGITFSQDVGPVTVKLLASYGRSTKSPPMAWTLGMREQLAPEWSPSSFWAFLPNPLLTPEYGRGGQGGIELYFGNLGSLSLNHYKQQTTDLIQIAKADSVWLCYAGQCGRWQSQNMYINAATIRQQGWEGTGSAHWNAFHIQATYSWMDSRVRSVHPGALGWSLFVAGQSMYNLPTHTGSISLGYAARGTTITWSSDFIGASKRSSRDTEAGMYVQFLSDLRDRTYLARRKSFDADVRGSGYAKSNLVVAHQLTRQISANLTVNNIANAFNAETDWSIPVLGRRTLLGFSIRWP